jgi:energy-coupling factor transport system ATP-binding protein
MPDDAPVLTINDLTFRYRDRELPAIRNINLELHPGELLLIAGASGCGKTTLIRCINGLIPRSYKGELQGQIFLQEHAVAGLPLAQISQMVGTVLQDPERQILGSKVVNEVAFGLENLGLPRPQIRQRVEDALQQSGIIQLKGRETFSLSGGEKQKLALAGVLAMRPSLIVLDEPLASLDPVSAQETLLQVRRLVDDGLAVILVEHRVEDVLGIHPDRVMYMADGQVRYLGPVTGLNDVVDPREIKMPAPILMNRATHLPPPPELDILPSGRNRYSSSTSNVLVSFQDVSFGYNHEETVLKGVNLDIHRGEVIAILGPNGAGKTTLVKQAIGLLKPRSGRVLVDGKDTRELSIAQIASMLGYVFQSPSHMLFAPTVKEELSFGPKNLGHKAEEIQKDVADALEIVNLVGRENDPPLALSFGQQKRVSIAAILAMRSRILVMDEPTAGQDYRNYMEFMDAIVQLPNFEAILFITHDIDLALVYANRVLIVGDGQIAADGPPHLVLKDFERLKRLRLVPTSLLQLNLDYFPKTNRFVRAETLAHMI